MAGSNKHCKLGFGKGEWYNSPAHIRLEDENNPLFIVDVGAGWDHSLFLAETTSGNQVWSCGGNYHHEISHTVGQDILPTHIKEHDGDQVTKIRCGYHSSVLITQNGKVRCTGWDAPPLQALKVLDGEKITEASVGYQRFIFVSEKGKCFVYGDNSQGQLGAEDSLFIHTAREISQVIDRPIVESHCSRYHTVLFTKDGDVFAANGKLGNESEKLEKIPGLNHPIQSASASDFCTAVSTVDGAAYLYKYSGSNKLTNTSHQIDFAGYIIQVCTTNWNSFFLENTSRRPIDFERSFVNI
jgi:alpha-tubulin suppressor-like RCC1 family protein